MSNRKLRASRFSVTLMCSAACFAIMTHSASAQTQSQSPSAEPPATTEVIVTGTNLRGVAPVGSAIIAVTRDDIVASGAVTTAQLLEESPQVSNLGYSDQSRGQSGGSGNVDYDTSINLHGLGPYSTLTIVDGQRVVPQGTTGQVVDPSIIPTIMLQRIDIEADGASATYGSDAIAGVVNLILRRNVEGVETSVQDGVGDHYNEHQLDALIGHRWDSGQFTLGVENSYNSALNGEYRSFYSDNLTSRGGGDFDSTSCNPGNIVVGGVTYPIPAGGVTSANASSLAPGCPNRCDPLKKSDILPMENHYSAAFTLDQRINDRIDISVDGLYAHKDIFYQGAPAASSLTVPSSNPYFVAPAGAALPFCPGSLTLRCETVGYSFDVPGDPTHGSSDTYQLSLKADVKLFADWKAELYGSWGRNVETSGFSVGINNSVINGSSSTVGSLSNPVAGEAFNPFGASQSQAVTQAISNALGEFNGATSYGNGELKFDGTLFTLPAGPVSAAFGYEGQSQLSSFLFQSGSTAHPVGFDRYFYRDVSSFFGEANIPIFGGAAVFPGLQALDIDIADRYDYYSDIKASTNNPKFGVNWIPIDGLKLRGTYGTSFRAPVFSQIYGNSDGIYVQPYSDPTCKCTVEGATVTGPNTGLKPETSQTWTVGFDYKPPWLAGLTLSVTYFDTVYQGQITNELANLDILETANLFTGTEIINRNPSNALLAQFGNLPVLGGTLPNACGSVTSFPTGNCVNKLTGITLLVDGRNKNLGVTDADGLDFQASYRWTTPAWGDFKVGVEGTYFTEFEESFSPTGPLFNVLNTTFNPLQLRFRTDTAWNYGPFTAVVYVNYANAYTNTDTTPNQSVSAYTTVDTHFAYLFNSDHAGLLNGVTLSLDITNLFDANPPFVNIAESQNGGGGWDPVNANPIGRVVAFAIDKKW